jgi:formiminoglutamase
MITHTLPSDPLWPRASAWLKASSNTLAEGDIALLGVPAFRSSITPTGAHETPAAVREALKRYSTYSASRDIDVATVSAIDLGDVDEPDGADGHTRVSAAASDAESRFPLLIAIGGDNSVTLPVMTGLAHGDLGGWGLVTVDAHHDLRDGESNGSPVRQLVADGLPGEHVVQIGIADFANSPEYAKRARDLGITVMTRASLRGRNMAEAAEEALRIAGHGGRPVYVDLDVDVCDRAEVPGCPAAAPGGITADELRQLAQLFASDTRVRGIDITEIDATIDAEDGRTVRLAALLVLEIATGYALRPDVS